ncbi:MAG: aryl-sulfate sulfotransferase [Cellvibrionales bacterium]|nr:aryl-sulfate sulfotransferase [Cellvibrionales bacterium]
MMRPKRLLALLLPLALTACDNRSGPQLDSVITLEPHPNPQLPLAARLSFTTQTPARATFRLSDNRSEWQPLDDQPPGHRTVHRIHLLGFSPSRRQQIHIRLSDAKGRQRPLPEPLTFTAPAVDIGGTWQSQNTAPPPPTGAHHGILLLLSNPAAPQAPSTAYAIDAQGEIRWLLHLDARYSGMQWLPNHRLLLTDAHNGRLEVDLLGQVHAARHGRLQRRAQHSLTARGYRPQALAADYPLGRLHPLTNGHRLLLDSELRDTGNLARGPQLALASRVVQVDANGQAVQTQSLFDLLNTNRRAPTANANPAATPIAQQIAQAYGFAPNELADWALASGLAYWPATDHLALTLPAQQTVVGIDRRNHRLRWRITAADQNPIEAPRLATATPPQHPRLPLWLAANRLLLVDTLSGADALHHYVIDSPAQRAHSQPLFQAERIMDLNQITDSQVGLLHWQAGHHRYSWLNARTGAVQHSLRFVPADRDPPPTPVASQWLPRLQLSPPPPATAPPISAPLPPAPIAPSADPDPTTIDTQATFPDLVGEWRLLIQGNPDSTEITLKIREHTDQIALGQFNGEPIMLALKRGRILWQLHQRTPSGRITHRFTGHILATHWQGQVRAYRNAEPQGPPALWTATRHP